MPEIGVGPSLSLIKTLLYIPFGLVFVLTAFIFLRAGYKKGLWVSLKSLAATIIAAFLSVILASLISKPITSLVVSLIERIFDGITSLDNQILMIFIEGALSVVVALGLFSFFLFILSIVMKHLSKRVQHEMFNKEVKHDKWAGLGVRFVDTCLFTFLLVLPFYGSISNYMPVVKAVLDTQQEVPYEVVQIVDTIVEHPLTKVYDVAPTNLVYSPLAKAKVGDASLDVVGTMNTANEVYGYIERIKNASSDEEIQTIVTELVNYVDEDVIQQRWLYEFAVSSAKELKSYMYKYPLDTVEKALAEEFFVIADITYDEYKTNAVAAMNFLKFLLNNNYIDNRDIDLYEDQPSLYEFGKLINATKQAVRCKQLLAKVLVLDEVGKENYDRVNTLISKALPLTPTAEANYVKEAKIFLELIEAQGYSETGKALAKFDTISQSEVQDWIDKKDDYDDYPGSSFENMYDQSWSGDGDSQGGMRYCVLNQNGSMTCYGGGGSVSFDGSGFSSGSFYGGSISSDGGNFSFSFSN